MSGRCISHTATTSDSQDSLPSPLPPSLPPSPRPLSWLESQKMGAFLSVAKGSVEVPWLLEVRYRWREGGEDRPLVLVGKGGTQVSHRVCSGSHVCVCC